METKIVEAKFKRNKLVLVLLVVGGFLLLFGIIRMRNLYDAGYEWDLLEGSFGEFVMKGMCFHPVGSETGECIFSACMIYVGSFCLLLMIWLHFLMDKSFLVLTDQRVAGKASFGRIVDLPLSQISAISLGLFGRITIATSSGRVNFWWVANSGEVHKELTDVLAKFQGKETGNLNFVQSNADELKKYKELLDGGIISQEEFEAKKKQLLGL